MTDKPKIEPGQVASPERPVHLVHDIGNRPTVGEIDGTLAAINYMRRQLDTLEKYIAAYRMAQHDDYRDGAA